MTPKVLVHFDSGRIQGGARAILGAAQISLDTVEIDEMTMPPQQTHFEFVYLKLAEDDERLPKLLELLRQHGLDWTEHRLDDYTDEELDNARLLFLRPNRECEVDGGSEFGTTYNIWGACPTCGAGARQTSALFLDGKRDELPKLKGHRAACTYREAVFVDDRIATELERLEPVGLVFHQVYALMPDKRQVKLPWKQLSADRILPPMSPHTTGISHSQPCADCSRSGFTTRGKEPNRIVYRASDLEGAGDINLTWEGNGAGEIDFGDPRKWFVPVPWLLVTPKVMRVFRAAGITEFEWVPIRVVDE